MLRTNLFAFLSFAGKFGLKFPKALSSSLYYTRNIEYPLCFNKLELENGLQLLDVGSGNSIFPIYLAERGILTYAIDNDEYILELKELLERSNLGFLLGAKRLNIQVIDVRKLDFSNDFFDRITAVSTLEHIPGDGDIKAMQEIGRVLKRGGKAFISLEANKEFKELTVTHNFYYGYPYKELFCGSLSEGQKPFASNYCEFRQNKGLLSIGFVRYYDKNAIFERIIKPSGLELEEIGFYADRHFPLRRLFDNTFLGARLLFFTSLIARLFYRKTEIESIRHSTSYLSNAIAYIILRKT